MEYKVYQIKSQGETEYVSGRTVIEALQTYLTNGDLSIHEDLEPETEMAEVPKEKWPDITITNTEFDENDPEDFESMTMEQWMNDNPNTSDIICGTPYL